MSSASAMASPAARSGRTLERLLPFVLFLLALLPGLYEFRHPTGYGFGHGSEMVSIARDLIAEGTFGNPNEPAITGPTAANPPLYPLILAGLMKLFGTPGYAVAATFGNILINATIAVLLLPLAGLLYGDRRPGVFAGLLWTAAMRLLPNWDTSTTVLMLLLFALVTAGEWRWRWIAGGILGGLATLLNPATILVLLPWLGYVLYRHRVPLRDAMRRVAFFLAIVGLCNVPWLIRNYRVWHTFVLRTNFGFTLYCSNNPCARSSLYETAISGCYQITHPNISPIEIRLLQSLGEVEYDRRRRADAMQWIRSNPDRFRSLTEARVFEFWFTDPGTAPRAAYAIWLITLLSIPGIVRMVRRKETAALFLGAVWLLYPLMFYVVVSWDRYRFPVLWTSALPAGYWLAAMTRRRVQPAAGPERKGRKHKRRGSASATIESRKSRPGLAGRMS
jgi:4-amino-4-deoxy-L-arabinose transferase-like glycosyltransferase